MRLVSTLVLLVAAGRLAAGQEPQSRPATRAEAVVTVDEWREWLDGLRGKGDDDAFVRCARESGSAGFAAVRLKDCGAAPGFASKGEKPSFLQPVRFVVSGFDPKETFVEAVDADPPVRFSYGAGFGARGVESIDVTGAAQIYEGDARSERVKLPEKVDFDDFGPLGKVLKEMGAEAEQWSVKNRIVFAIPRHNEAKPSAVPKFARGLKGMGASVVVVVDDAGAAETAAAIGTSRKDKSRRPAGEDPPALFVTVAAGTALGRATGVPVEGFTRKEPPPPGLSFAGGGKIHKLHVRVRWRMQEIDVPNVAGAIEAPSASEFVILSAPGGGEGRAAASLLAATRMLARMPAPARRSIVVLMHAKPEVPVGGQDWFLSHLPVPSGKIVSAVHLAWDERPREAGASAPPGIQMIKAARACAELEPVAAEALRAQGTTPSPAPPGSVAQRAVDAYAARGIPSIGLLASGDSIEDGLLAARVAAALSRDLADRPKAPALPGR